MPTARQGRANASVFGKDERIKVTDTAAQPWQAIGQVETASGNLCTATLISRTALTAGHCVLAPPGQLDKAIALRFVAGDKSGSIKPAISRPGRQQAGQKLKPDGDGWIVPPAAAAYDFALIRLKDKSRCRSHRCRCGKATARR